MNRRSWLGSVLIALPITRALGSVKPRPRRVLITAKLKAAPEPRLFDITDVSYDTQAYDEHTVDRLVFTATGSPPNVRFVRR